MRTLIFALGLSVALCASAAADPATTQTAAAMREAPSGKSRIVQRVPANAQIDLSQCSGNWCYASWRDRFGYLPAAAVAGPLYPASPYPPPPPAYPPPDGAWSGAGLGPFYFGYGWSRW
jgi:hypothetical protein